MCVCIPTNVSIESNVRMSRRFSIMRLWSWRIMWVVSVLLLLYHCGLNMNTLSWNLLLILSKIKDGGITFSRVCVYVWVSVGSFWFVSRWNSFYILFLLLFRCASTKSNVQIQWSIEATVLTDIYSLFLCFKFWKKSWRKKNKKHLLKHSMLLHLVANQWYWPYVFTFHCCLSSYFKWKSLS